MDGKALLIGYGNPLRGDDGIGQVVAEALAAEADLARVQVLSCLQLAPELAESLARSVFAVFVDAAADQPAGSVHLSVLQAAGLPHSPLGHHLEPRNLLALAKTLYGSAPPAVLVAVGAAQMGVGEGLSPVLAAALPEVVATVQRLLAAREAT